MSDRIIFLIAPIGGGKNWMLDNIDDLFKFDDKPRIYFRFGTMERIDIPSAPFPRIHATIEDHRLQFPDRNFIYYGWELSDCIEEIFAEYPTSEFFFTTKEYNESSAEKLADSFLKKRESHVVSQPLLTLCIKEKIKLHTFQISKFLSSHNFQKIDISNMNNDTFSPYSKECFYVHGGQDV
jgi:hypothetical protein